MVGQIIESPSGHETSAFESNIGQHEFLKFQGEQMFETYRMHYSQAMQLIATVTIVDVTLVGYSISTQIAGILFIGALCPLLVEVIVQVAGQRILPILYSLVSLEMKYGGGNDDWLASTFVAHDMSPDYVGKLRSISLVTDTNMRIAQLRRMRMPLFSSIAFRIMLLVIAVGQILISLVLSIYFGWRLI